MRPCDRALAQRLELHEAHSNADYVTALRADNPASSADALWIADGVAISTGVGIPASGAYGIGSTTNPVAIDAIAAIEAFYAEHGIPARIEVTPFTQPSVLATLGRGEWRIERFTNVWLRAIVLADGESPPAVVGITTRHAHADEADQWAEVAANASTVGSARSGIQTLARATFHRPDVTPWVAISGEQIIGTAAMLIRDRLATLFFMSTLPDQRGRGVQAALLSARLAQAASAGCDSACISAVPGGNSERNIARAGFTLIYTKLCFTC